MSIWITELGKGSLAVKDLFDTAGVRTTYGSAIFADHVPSESAGPMARDVEGCERMMKALVPGFSSADVSLADVRIGVAWTERADPLVRARVEEVAAGFERVEVPWPDGVYPAFSREIVEVHADLYPANRDRYDPSIVSKMDKARAVTDEAVEAARAERDRYRERIAALAVDLLLMPTIPMVAPPVGVGDLALRERMIELTFPWNVTGSPALALPCGPAEDGLPASLQVIGRPGEDALVLAAGRALSERVHAAHGRDAPPA